MDVKTILLLFLLQIAAIFPLLSSSDQLNQNQEVPTNSAADFPVQLGHDSLIKHMQPHLPQQLQGYYEQVLDHFNYVPESYRTFQQRYLINSKYWGGANSSAPIFACLGAEAPIDDSPQKIGFLTDNTASFNALLVYIEHRYYGGPDLNLTLRRFASNIIFSNGLRDPFSSGGVLESISSSLVAVSTVNGTGWSHCLDLATRQLSDPEWLVTQRNTEVKIIEGWIAEYHARE